MIRDLFVNATIIIACISIGNQILINKEITPSAPMKIRLFFSLMSAVMGIILMFYTIHILPDVILDFRNIPILLSATYCGIIPVIITGSILGLFRLVFQGITLPSIIACSNILVMALSCAITLKFINKRILQWILMTVYALIYPTLNFILVLNDNDLLVKTIIIYWISTILASIAVYIYIQYIDLLRISYQKFRRDSYKDYRTGLNNVRQFDKEFNNIVNKATDNSEVSLLFIDIDYFKKVNDVYGHQNGDKVLEDLGKILLSATTSEDVVSRNGGEEFSVILTDCPQEKVLDVAERIRRAVQDHKFYLLDGKTINITISIGAAIYPHNVNNIEDLKEKADLALYEAKRTGRNKTVLA